jgi:hypothetical protein
MTTIILMQFFPFGPFYLRTLYLWRKAWRSYKIGDYISMRIELIISALWFIPSMAGIDLLVKAISGG